MERRLHQRFEASAFERSTQLEIDCEKVRFHDFSETGFSFSSTSLLSVGDRFELQLIAVNKERIFLAALICNRHSVSLGNNRYGAFFDVASNQFEDYKLYLDSIGTTVPIN